MSDGEPWRDDGETRSGEGDAEAIAGIHIRSWQRGPLGLLGGPERRG